MAGDCEEVGGEKVREGQGGALYMSKVQSIVIEKTTCMHTGRGGGTYMCRNEKDLNSSCIYIYIPM